MKEKEKKWSLFRKIISIIDSTLKLILLYVKKKTIISVGVVIIIIGVPTIVIPRIASKKNQTQPLKINTNPPEASVKTDDEPTSEGPKEIQKDTASGTQPTKKKPLSEELQQVWKGVKSDREQMEGMRQTVEEIDETRQDVSETVEKMQERLDSLSEN